MSSTPKTAVSLFKALADPTRLRLLVRLKKGETCVGDLVEILKVPQPTASRHLAYLRRSGLVKTRKQGQWIFYGLSQPRSAFERALFQCLDCCFEQVPEVRGDQQRAARLKKKGGCC